MAAPRFINELTAVTSLSAGAAVAVFQDGVTLRSTPQHFITQAESFTQSGTADPETVQGWGRRKGFDVQSYGANGDGVTDDYANIVDAYDACPAGGILFFPQGTYKIAGASTTLTIAKSIHIIFAAGAKLQFEHHTTGNLYVNVTGSDVVIEDMWVDGAGASRVTSAGIKVQGDAQRVRLVRPKIIASSGGGIIVEDAVDVQIDSPYVEGSFADGIHITSGAAAANVTKRVTVTSPICVNTGDDSISVVSYNTATALVEDVTITGAISIDSTTAGFACAGGRRVRYEGVVYSPTVRGVRVERDSSFGTHDVFSVSIKATVYQSGSDGLRVGVDVYDSDFDVIVFDPGGRGVNFGSGNATDVPMRNRLNAMVYDGAGIGIDIDGVDGLVCGMLYAENNATTGISLTGTVHNVAIGAMVAKNNNTSVTAGVDNITIIDDATGAPTNLTIGAITSVDANSNIDRTLEINDSVRVNIGSFIGVKGTTLTGPAFSGTNTDVYVPMHSRTGSATFNPASLADGAGETTTVTVVGAALGDYAIASFSLDTQGITITAWVSAADTVSVRFQNESGGLLDIGSGTLRCRVIKIAP